MPRPEGRQVLSRIDIVPCRHKMDPIPPGMETVQGFFTDDALPPRHLFENTGIKRSGAKADQIVTAVEGGSDNGIMPVLQGVEGLFDDLYGQVREVAPDEKGRSESLRKTGKEGLFHALSQPFAFLGDVRESAAESPSDL